MERLFELIIKKRKNVVFIFIVATLLSIFLLFFVNINYNLVDYLPVKAQSTKALKLMESEFEETIPNTTVMVKDVSLMEALEYKEKLAAIDGVRQVVWLDDMMDIKEPLEMGDRETIEGFYKEGDALFSATISKGMEKEACSNILDLIGNKGALTGEAPGLVFIQEATTSSVIKALVILLPVVILILILSTTSWIEPLIFLVAIGISIVINMGTNILFGKISFMTNSISPILQLACSLDYAVFLLHSFADKRKQYADVKEAMLQAMKESMSTVAASAMTTLFGFLALLFMNFGIGADLGMALAKGIIFSFISVMVFLPALTLYIYKMIDRTKHRAFMTGLRKIHLLLSKIAVPAVIIVLILIVPSFLGQSRTSFLYGNDTLDPHTRYGKDTIAVEKQFGKSTVMALLVPRGEVAKEEALTSKLKEHTQVTGVVSYVTEVGAAIPPEYLNEGIRKQFYSENFTRLILYTDTPAEGEQAFNTVEKINETATSYYGDGFYILGESANLYDMKHIVQKDNLVVNLIAIGAIFIVLLATFKSAVLPFLLVLTIEAGIWINLAIPYFNGTPINFLGYLVISTVQLGATVDYAILLTNTYLANRKRMLKRKAISASVNGAFQSILVSALTLSTAGFTLYATSSNSAIADIGLLLGRGTLLSLALVLLFLPTLLVIFDRAIEKYTYRIKFFNHSQ